MKLKNEKISKTLSLVLRHKPEQIGIVLDIHGWTEVTTLLSKLSITFEELDYIVETNAKKRFAFNIDKTKVRANQGHSVEVDLGFSEKTPPQLLYHGTSYGAMCFIEVDGIKKMKRHHVHLSDNNDTAYTVGKRHGASYVLLIDSAKMVKDGYKFYQSENGVWLTDFVPVDYILNLNESLNGYEAY